MVSNKQLNGLKKGWGWNKGIRGKKSHMFGRKNGCFKHSEEQNKKQSERMKGHIGYTKGLKFSEKTKELMSIAHRGEKCHFWQGGISNLYTNVRGSFKYRQWVSDIFTRDNFICQECGQRGGKLHAHHIKQFALIMKENNVNTFYEAMECSELWNINNGKTYCYECHRNTDTYLSGKVKLLSTASSQPQPQQQQTGQQTMVGNNQMQQQIK
jgi:hypothetical protein